MMATEKQVAANRANAKRSTGPRTQEGKNRSSMNSRKHALLAKTIVIDGEDPAEFEDLLTSFVEEFNPNPGCECELVFFLATNFWRLRRIPRFEARSLRAQESDSVYRDPRVDRLIEDEIMRRKTMAKVAERYGAKPSGSTDEDDEKRIRARFDELLPPEASQPLPSPSETQETLAKISRYETALMNSISRTFNMLIGLQNIRTERAQRRRLKLVNQPGRELG
ncbi:MAG: hypothetical protein ACREC3_14820 [Methyloceanibacter sp.]